MIAWIGEGTPASDGYLKRIRDDFPGPKRPGYNYKWERRSVINRAYWSRLWIVQEFLLAKRVVIMCGFSSCLPEMIEHSLHEVFPIEASSWSRSLIEARKRFVSRAEDVCLENQLQLCWERNCVDPRDKIFGIAGIVKSGPGRG